VVNATSSEGMLVNSNPVSACAWYDCVEIISKHWPPLTSSAALG